VSGLSPLGIINPPTGRAMRYWIVYSVVGATAFWGPETLWALIMRKNAPWQVLTALLSLTLCATYGVVLRIRRRMASGPSAAGSMLVGIFVLGPWFMTLTSTFNGSGGGFHEVKAWYDWLFLLMFSFVPPYTLMMSGYDASVFALLLVTIFLTAAHFTLERRRWLLPLHRNRRETV
jgi:hypothetical protein